MTGYSPTYNLKAVILETGLSPATLRAWERRYGLLKPQRSPGGHRLYSEHDIKMLKWLVARQAEGLSISHAVEMWRSLEDDAQDPLREIHAPPPVVGASGSLLDQLRSNWLSACLAYDEQAAEQALAQAFAIAAPEIVCTEVLQKGLAEIGQGWSTGVVSVQQEHFASGLAIRRLNTLLSASAAPTRRGRILAACPPGEQHDFILLMLVYLLRRRGWDVVYLGANVPLAQLDTAIWITAPRLILSVAQTLNSAASLKEMANYANAHNVLLAYGGGIFIHIPALSEYISGYFLGTDLANAPQSVERLISQPPSPPKTRPVPSEYIELLNKLVEKEAYIIASVADAMQPGLLEPSHLEEANSSFTSHIISALMLGDINFLDPTVAWLERLFENNKLPPSLSAHYYAAYHQALQQHLGGNAAPILHWLAKFDQPKPNHSC